MFWHQWVTSVSYYWVWYGFHSYIVTKAWIFLTKPMWRITEKRCLLKLKSMLCKKTLILELCLISKDPVKTRNGQLYHPQALIGHQYSTSQSRSRFLTQWAKGSGKHGAAYIISQSAPENVESLLRMQGLKMKIKQWGGDIEFRFYSLSLIFNKQLNFSEIYFPHI